MQNLVWTESMCHKAVPGDWAQATAADVSITIPADTNGHMICIENVWGGYDLTPLQAVFLVITGGADGNTVVGKAPLGTCGFFIPVQIKSFPGQAIKATVTSGGGGVTGYINVKWRVDQVG